MPAKPSGEIKTRIVKVKQKNGDTYVYSRQVQYDPEKKYNRNLSSKLLYKIPKGETEPVPTRPKRKSEKNEAVADLRTSDAERQDVPCEKLQASRICVGMMQILEHIGIESGIDSALYAAMDVSIAQKTISLARYFLATNGQTSPGITTWQFSHQLPYRSGFSETIIHELYSTIGYDETVQQNFFKSRCLKLDNYSAIAYDSTTISSYSERQKEAVYGYNKDGDSLKTIKIITLYSIDNNQPIAFSKQPGNIPDVISIKNALNELTALGVENAEIITDNGFYSSSNIAEMFYTGFNFITLIKTNISWVKHEIDNNYEELNSINTLCELDPNIHCSTVKITHSFTRKECNISKDEEKDTNKSFKKEIFLHLFFSVTKQAEERKEFDSELIEYKKSLESGKIKMSDLEGLDLYSRRKRSSTVVKRIRALLNSRTGSDAEDFSRHGYKKSCKIFKCY